MKRVTLLTLLLPCFLMAQKRPQVGLVLSGGGAKGFAHVGVLEILDSLEIPIDMVSGTSMGAIVGGLYAIGYSGDQIDSVVRNTYWSEVLSNEPQRLYRPFSARSLEDRYLLRVGFSDFKPLTPSGFINGQKIYTTLMFLIQGYHGQQDFLKFPRKFICVATELNNGYERVFTKGHLVDAMRASMAIPSVFKPYIIDGKFHLDGGIVNNFPSDKLAEQGAAIIIGVDVQTTFSDTISRPNLTRIIEKTSMYKNFQTTLERELLCDLIVRPDMTGFSVGDFESNAAIIEAGKNAARAMIPELLAIKKKLDRYKIAAPPTYRPLPKVIAIKAVGVAGLQKVDKATVIGILDVRAESEVAVQTLENNLKFLYGTGLFEQVWYELLPAANGKFDLIVKVQETDYNGSINLGLRYDPDFRIGILINLNRKNLLFRGGQFNLDMVLGETPRYLLDYHFNRGALPGFGISSQGISSNFSFFSGGSFQGLAGHDDITTKLYWQATTKSEHQVGGFMGYQFAGMNFSRLPSLREELKVGELEPRFSHFLFGGFYRFDRMNKSTFPTKGTAAEIEVKFVDGIRNTASAENGPIFLNISWNYQRAKEFAPGWTVLPSFRGALVLLNDATLPYKAFLGGLGQNYFNNQIPMLGMRYRELGTYQPFETPLDFFQNSAVLAGLEIRWQPIKNLYTSAIAQVGGVGNRPLDFVEKPEYFLGYGLRASYNTVAGPLEITVHRSSAINRTLVYFNYGFWF